tara:strand:- start:344 stop:784 length:441 start_codon:yes stop_codon:yes gene_type:complete
MKLKSQNKIEPTFNMSSMTDVVFLLLIFFIIIAQFMSPNALGLTLPNSDSEQRVNSSDITVTIQYLRDKTSNDDVVSYQYNNGQKTIATQDLKELSDYLKNQVKSDTLMMPLVLQAEAKVQIQDIITVVDEAVKYNYEIIFATQSK